MDHLARATDHFAATPSLVRQPSAEDLDAAHQLVSSARGGRGSLSGSHERSGLESGHGPFLDGGSSDRVTGSFASHDHPMLSGQICRYDAVVFRSISRYS